MKVKYILSSMLVAALMPFCASAQEHSDKASIHMDMMKNMKKHTPVKKLYWSNGIDGAIFSSSILKKTGEDSKLSTLRFTYVVNFGFNLNYDFSSCVGIYTGVGIKNIGFIEKIADSTIKRRVYTFGVPFGIKIGNLQKRNFILLGGGLDVPFNYREKGFVKRSDKQKFNEWFSNRTETLMPYVFAGFSVSPGITFKLQYYPNNFLNREYRDKDLPKLPSGAYQKPYVFYEKTNLILLSIGMDMHYKSKKMHHHHDDDEQGTEPAQSM